MLSFQPRQRGLRWWASKRLADHEKDFNMTKTQLTDLQLVLLANACARKDESLIPATASLAGKESAVRKALAQLLKRGLVVETTPSSVGAAWRTDGDLRFGLMLSDLGRAAIGLTAKRPGSEEDSVSARDESSIRTPASAAVATSPPATTKTAIVLALMSRDQGATLAELVEATRWLPHTTRAALTGLRKKGHDLVKSKRADVTCYKVAQGRA
jgi:hypothetical protein